MRNYSTIAQMVETLSKRLPREGILEIAQVTDETLLKFEKIDFENKQEYLRTYFRLEGALNVNEYQKVYLIYQGKQKQNIISPIHLF
jgi:hypothetical protein